MASGKQQANPEALTKVRVKWKEMETRGKYKEAMKQNFGSLQK